MTKKQIIELLNSAASVTATMQGGRSIEDWTEYCSAVMEAYPDAIVNPTGIYFEDNRFILAPKINRVRIGKMQIKASRYSFSWTDNAGPRDSHGDTKDLKENNGGLELAMFNGAIIRYDITKS